MKRLNLRTAKKYDYADEEGTILPRIHFYCISEGATEETYFFGIRNNKAGLGIKNDVRIEEVKKQEGQETLSHPLQLVKAALVCMGRINESGEEIPEKEWGENCKWDDFDPEIDQVCVIFDRDYKDLQKNMDEIFRLCDEYRIKVVISNPNFELWLLMHFPNIEQYPRGDLLANKKNVGGKLFKEASVKKKYLEILVSKNAGGYSKGSKLEFEKFLPFIDLAIEQAKKYCEDARKLIDELGTSMGILLREMWL